jgi:cytochrome b
MPVGRRLAIPGRKIANCGLRMNDRATRLVWDLPVRVTHWLLVITVLGSYVTSQWGTKLFNWHKYCGYTILVLVTFRIAWGFVGTRYARFEQFMRSPRQALQYFGTLGSKADSRCYVGHNPLGGWSIVAMLALLMAQASTGLFANDDVSSVGPLFGWVSNSLSNTLTKFHHIFFNMLEALIVLHILVIAYYGYRKKENLLTPMVTGRKPATIAKESDEIQGSQIVLALAMVAALAGALAVVLLLAPEASLAIF